MAHPSKFNDLRIYWDQVLQHPSFASNAFHQDSSGWFTQANPEADLYGRVVRKASENVIPPADGNIKVDLHDWELWNKFSAAGTEMIVSKGGRRMFPGFRVRVSGMDPNAQYCVLMEMSRLDEHRYKFQNGQWSTAGQGEPHVPEKCFLHLNSPASGQFWMNEIVSFHKVKLSNYCGNPDKGKFFVNSLHRYQPRIHIVRTDDVSNVHLQPKISFSFQQTEFKTVTVYQNQEVTKLKVQNNPFARGFRPDGGKTKNAISASSTSLHEAKRQKQSTQQRKEETVESHQIPRKDPRITSSALPKNFEPQYQAFHAAPPTPINRFNFSQLKSSTATSMELNQPTPCYNSRRETLSLAALQTNNFSAPVASLEGCNLAAPSQDDSTQAANENSTYQSNGTSFVDSSNYVAPAHGPVIQTDFVQANDGCTDFVQAKMDYPPFTAPAQFPCYNPSLPYHDEGCYLAPTRGKFRNAQDCAFDAGYFKQNYDEANDDCSNVNYLSFA
ncbi:unnamed protein product [Clavelina lepadiformis]|uniref:T-box domain-containing protein n=1 Tax=Clavelina lepadiformis TaxID=159417 RepID=A0ABP0GD78_CLALP